MQDMHAQGCSPRGCQRQEVLFMYYHHAHRVLFWHPFLGLLLLALLVLLVVWLVSLATRPHHHVVNNTTPPPLPPAPPAPPAAVSPPAPGSPEAILAERFARGEIDAGQYQSSLAVLRGSSAI